jgi:predicted nucleotidyltransferase
VSCLATLLDDPKELLPIILATAGGGFALWRWTVDQKWRRVQHAQSLVEKFLDKRNTIKAFEILDTIGEVECESMYNLGKKETINITDKFLIGALSTFDQRTENDDNEIIVRDIFDDFFDDLGTFQSHIDTKLIKLKDIKPYLEYWIQELTGHGRVHNVKFGNQVAKYLDFFGYDRVVKLAEDMGRPFNGIVKTISRNEIIATLNDAAPALRAEGVTRLAIFGSRARGDARDDSNLNVLIDVNATFSGLDLIGVQHIIRAATGLETRAEMRRSLDLWFVRRMADDVIEIF